MSLSREVDKYLKDQAKLDEKGKKIIEKFSKEHRNHEVCNVVDYVISHGSPQYVKEIKEFKQHYEEGGLKVNDVKTYLMMYNIHKDEMKEPKEKENN